MNQTTTKKTIYVDASSLKSDSLCDRRYLLHIIRGYVRGLRAENYKAGYGVAFHTFLELYYSKPAAERSKHLVECTQAALSSFERYLPYIPQDSIKEFRSPLHLLNACQSYHQHWGRGDYITAIPVDDNEHLLERKFCVPWFEDETLVIYLTGTIDMVGEVFGKLAIIDHKSTAAYDPQVFFSEFELNIQTMFYVLMFRRLSKMDRYLPIMINGIFIKKPTAKAEKDGQFDGARFVRSNLIEYSDDRMEEFERYLDWQMNKILTLARMPAETFGQINPAACHGKFSTCSYYELCSMPLHKQKDMLESIYRVEAYSPLNFND